MLVYILVVLFPLLIEELYKKNVTFPDSQFDIIRVRKIRWKYIFIAALPMFFLIAFRNQNIGADTNGYLEHFSRTIGSSWAQITYNSRMEHGYLFFVKLITYVTHNPLVYQVICVSIYLLALTSFTNQLDQNHFLFLFLFGTLGMYTFMFTGVRQCLAISICLFSFRFIKNRKFIWFVILMLIAFCFHKSSILFIAAYFIYTRKLSFSNFFIYFAFLLFSIANLSVIQEWFNEQLEYNYEIEDVGGGTIYLLVLVVIMVFVIFFAVYNKQLTRKYNGLINIGIIAVVFWVLRLFTRVAERPSYYFLPFIFAAFAYSLSNLKSSKEKVNTRLVVILVALVLFTYRFMTNFSSLIPYRFYSF